MEEHEIALAGRMLAMAFALALARAMLETASELGPLLRETTDRSEGRDVHPAHKLGLSEQRSPVSLEEGGNPRG